MYFVTLYYYVHLRSGGKTMGFLCHGSYIIMC